MTHAYTRAVARATVAQIAESLGFDAIQHSACEALAELLLRYISEIGYLTHTNAEYAGRPDCNINDLLLAFQDMGIDMQQLMDSDLDMMPFAHSMPRLPTVPKAVALKTFKSEEQEPPAHIPSHLPVFPDKHTYMETAVFAGHTKDVKEQKQAQLKAKKDAEKAIIALHEREAAATSQGDSGFRNLFLSPPEIAEPSSRDKDDNADQPSHIFAPTSEWKEDEPAGSSRKQQKILDDPFKLDLTKPQLPRAPITGFEDAFADMPVETIEKSNKRRRSIKSAATDPQIERAQQILAAGQDAVFLDDGQPEKSGR